jgi:type I restriction enzyme S subunit
MNGQDLRNSILQLAIQGKLVEQRQEEGTAKELLEQIIAEKERLIREKKIKRDKSLLEITEEEIPFEIPESWRWVRLGDVSENIHYGYTASAKDNGNCKLLRITDIQNNSVDWESVPCCEVKEKDYTTYGLNNRDILIARTGGTIGKTYIVDSLNDKVVFASYLIRVIPVKHINENYLKIFMESPLYWIQLKSGSMGTGQPNVNGTTLSNLLLPVPPLEEQGRILLKIDELVPYLDQYSDAHAKVEEFNKKFPAEVQKSILQYAIKGKLVEQRQDEGTAEDLYQQIQAEKAKLVKEGKIKREKSLPVIAEEEIPFDIPESWKWVRLGDVIDLLSGQDFPPEKYNDFNKGIPYITGASSLLNTGVTVSRWTEEPRCIANAGDVLLVCKGSGYGKTVICDVEEAHIARQIMSIRNSRYLNMMYVKYFMEANHALIKQWGQGVIPGIDRKSILIMLIPLPPLEEQKRIVAKIEELLPFTKQLVK